MPSDTMHAGVLTEYKRFEWKEVPIPRMTETDVLVKVAYASICGSDQHIFSGEFHPRTKLPLIPGHEFVGTVASVGSQVNSFKPGETIAVDPIIWCGTCPACRLGHYPACSSLKLLGIDLNGGFAEYIIAQPSMLYKVPTNVQLEHASLVEILAIGFHACRRAKVKAGDSIVIWGAGKVGQSILQAARTKTDGPVFLVDILENRLARAKGTYSDIVTINALKEDPVAVVREHTKNNGVDIAFEAVGHAHHIKGRINPVRGCVQSIRGAGTVCVLGLSDEPAPVVFKELIFKEAKIIASRVNSGEFAEVIENLARGTLVPNTLISEILPARKIQYAFEILEQNPEEHLKILLDFSHSDVN